VNSGAFLRYVEALVGVVNPRITGPVASGIMGWRTLGDDRQAAAADRMMAEKLLEAGLAVDMSGAQLQPKHDQPIEPARRLRRRQVDGDAHADRDRTLEVHHPFQLVGDEQIAAVGMDRRGWIGLGIRGGIGTDVERDLDHAADGLQRLLAAIVAEHQEALGELLDLRRLRPSRLSGRRIGREDHEGG